MKAMLQKLKQTQSRNELKDTIKELFKTKTVRLAVIGISVSFVGYYSGMMESNTAVDIIYMSLFGITGRDAIRKIGK